MFELEFGRTTEHHWLIASIPTDLVPLYKSNHCPGLSETGKPPADCKLWWRIEKVYKYIKKVKLYKWNQQSQVDTCKISKAAPRATSIIGKHSYLWVKVIFFNKLSYLVPERNKNTIKHLSSKIVACLCRNV
jgi:hypothetical protein